MTDSSRLRDMGKALSELFTFGKLDHERELPVEVTFALIGYLAKADSIITSHEAEFVNALMDELDLPTQGRALANASFERGRLRQIDIKVEGRRFVAAYGAGSRQVHELFDTLLGLSAADGRVFPRERQALSELAAALGLNEADIDRRLETIRGI
ncbi:TerB family tellurite resistance protein [Chiayiivirga flava]|uniref:Tellurite resistance protein n=1 Tax=Chiayiivirga flava TaxID=659595 RepID=A0A7W8FY20_9GAMM|nr:TerB family tellurite resistance protein [Chiayiivirga flava]MBB5206631.1 tellurite resistance protein [Chiayiivirga flava]